jgi:hypothetical protein
MTKARDLGKLVSQGQPLADGTVQASEVSGLAVVATSGSYNDLLDKPTSTPGSFSGNYADLTNKPTFATVATSGSYADLTNKPTLFSGSYSDLTNKPTLFDGSYNTLTDKPTLFSGSYADLTNKPTLFSGSYTDLTNTPTLFSGSYTDLTNKPNFATVATSGSYTDLTNKPTIISLKGTSITYPEDDLAANPAGGQTILVVGTGFEATPTVYVGGTIASSVSFVSSTQITFVAPPKSAGTYDVYIVNPGGATAIMVMAISYSGVPNWTTAAGSLGTVEGTVNVQLQATSNSAITYTLASGSILPSGITLSSSGLLSGTTNVEQTFSFTVVATDLENQDTSRSFQVTVSIADPYFPYNTLLLAGNGTNAAQNNTFVDSSPNNFSITRSGNVSQGTFSPYGSNWSNYFETGASRLTAANTANWQFGTGDFTVEAFVFLNSISEYRIIVKCAEDGTWNIGWTLNIYAGQLQLWINNTTGAIGGGTLTAGTWNHVAATRSGTTVRLFVNGTIVATATNSTNIAPANNLSIGGENATANYPVGGYISNLRVNKGTALYTSNFVPATTPLTAVSGTVLLTCQGNRFVDRSSSAVSLTITGTPRVERLSPFNPTTSYAAGTIGGSGCFDAINDTLTTATSANLNLGTGAFQIDFWMYTTASPGQYMGPFGTNNAGGTGGIFFANRGGNLDFTNNYDTAGAISAPFPSLNEWHHIVVVRNSSNVRAYYVDGVRVGSLSNAVDFNQTQFILGAYNASFGGWAGYISDFRVIVGTNIVDPNMTTIAVPTAPSTAVTGTQLLLNFTNAGIIDNAMMNDLETVGNAQISTAQSKFGGGSLYFDGTGDWLKASTGRIADFGTGDFTIEAWVYLLSHDGDQSAVFAGGLDFTSFTQPNVNIDTTGTVNLNGNQPTSNALSLNTWTHIAVSRSSGTCRIFINGVQGSSASNTLNYNGIGCYVGVRVGGSVYGDINGYIDDLRITKGYARYTANFTPPTSAHKLR